MPLLSRPARWAAVLFMLLGPSPVRPQTVPTLRTETRVVQIDVAATDSHGRPVSDLTRQNFTVLDNGKPRDIQIFALESLPASVRTTIRVSAALAPPTATRTTVLLMDSINDYFEDHVRAWKQAIQRIQNLQPGERMALYVLDSGIRILQNYTADRELLLKSLRSYKPPPLKTRGIGGPRGGARGGTRPAIPGGDDVSNEDMPAEREFRIRQRAADTFDAFRAIANHLAMMPGRKSLIWLSAGFPPEPLRELSVEYHKATAAMNEANVALYAVDARGLMAGRGDMSNIAAMRELAEATGGKAYFHRNDLDHAIAEAGDDVRVTYTLGFYVPDEERDGKFHELRVRANRPHLELRYRKGYYAGAEPTTSGRKRAPLDEELLNPLDATGIRIGLRLEKVSGEFPTLRLHLTLDPQTVTLMPAGDGWTGKVDQLFVESDERGAILAKIDDSGEFRVTPQTRPQFDRVGAAYARDIRWMDRAVKLQIIVRDTASGHVGSLTVALK